jgi:hypothetical protein
MHPLFFRCDVGIGGTSHFVSVLRYWKVLVVVPFDALDIDVVSTAFELVSEPALSSSDSLAKAAAVWETGSQGLSKKWTANCVRWSGSSYTRSFNRMDNS